MRPFLRIALAAVAVAALAAVAWFWLGRREEPPRPRDEVVGEIDAELTRLSSRGLAGAVVLEQDGQVLLSKGYGLADRASGRAVTPDTGFDIGSLVKPFTTLAVLKLETQGALHRSDSIARFLPGFPADKARITLQQLLTHSSGLPDIVDADGRPWEYTTDYDYEPVSRDELLRRAVKARLVFEPGAKSEYSNLGFSLLGAIVEIASGEPYERFLQRAVLTPAGMTRTGYQGPGWQGAELAVGYRGDARWGTPLDHPWLADGPSWNLRANGGMLSTAGDLHRWIRAVAGDAFLTPAEKNAFFELTVHLNKRGVRTMGAAGSNTIFDAAYLWYPDEQRTLVMVTSSDSWRAEKLIPDLARKMRSIRPPGQ
jgi:CubicO group peptidase (beta-lactamase class C family)